MKGNFRSFTFGTGKTYRSHPKDLFVAIEIENPTPHVQNLTFFGIHEMYWKKEETGLKIRSIIGDELFNNPDLTELFNLCSLNPLMVRGFVFNTSMLYDMFKGKNFSILQCNAYGESSHNHFFLLNHWNKDGRNPQSAIVDASMCLDISLNLKLTTIAPGERIVMFLDTSGKKSEDALESMIIHANSIYNKEKTRKILLII